MEWVNGDSLYHLLRGEGQATLALDPRVAARIVADACAGLHAAHELEAEDGRALAVVHRDVSPQNVLVALDGHAKVADFGVAKALGQLHDATIAGQLRGKVHYMSPEQITGAVVDRRSDVFALGCVLYEATTGIKAFDGEAEHLAMQAVIAGKYPRPSQLVPGYPAGLEQIVARAIAASPASRFATAERMRVALEQWLAKSGALVVTHSDVARVARQRIGRRVDARKERLRQALTARGERLPMPSIPPETSTAPGRASQSHSGVKALGALGAAQAPGRSEGGSISSRPPPSVAAAERTAPPAYGTPPPPSLAAARAGFDLMDPPIPSVPPPPEDVAELAARVEAVEPLRRARGGSDSLLVASAVALLVGVGGGLAWRALTARDADAPRAQPTASARAAPPGPVEVGDIEAADTHAEAGVRAPAEATAPEHEPARAATASGSLSATPPPAASPVGERGAASARVEASGRDGAPVRRPEPAVKAPTLPANPY